MTRKVIFISTALSAVLISGCGTFVTPGNSLSSRALEIPPDLTSPNTISATRVPNISGAAISAETVRKFELFQSTEKLADYQDFLEWRKTHTNDEETNIASFQEFKQNQRAKKLSRDGVLVVEDDIDREILLISDTLDNSWNRIDTALINLNLQLLNSDKSSHVFQISYNVGREGGTERGWRNWATRLTGRAVYELRLQEQARVVVASLYDRNNRPITSETANTLLRRLASQLKTFAGKEEQFVTGGIDPLPGLSIQKDASGQIQLIIPEKPAAAWPRVFSALRRANFSIESRDNDALSFWIRYVEPGSKPNRSLLHRLGLRKQRYPQVIDRYRIQLSENSVKDTTTVTIWNVTEQPAEIEEEILYVIFEKLKN